ncbi:MAG: tetratricopeptide repeat protein, partial [Lachnospiraceae bacterium]|nr:tetratricopeptide repeat protein [Lachnospiraceae bacterium]
VVYGEMLTAIDAYLKEDYLTAAQLLAPMDQTVVQTEAFAGVYNAICPDAVNRAVADLYSDGYEAYETGDYDTSKELLTAAYELTQTHTGVIYYLGRSYQRSGDSDTGRKYLQEILDKFPNDSYAQYARQYYDR